MLSLSQVCMGVAISLLRTFLLVDNYASDHCPKDDSPRGQFNEGDNSPRGTIVRGDNCASALLCEETPLLIIVRGHFLLL